MDEQKMITLLADMESRLATSFTNSIGGISNQLASIESKLSSLEGIVSDNSKKIDCNTITANSAKTIASAATNDIKDLRTDLDVLSQNTSDLAQFRTNVDIFNNRQTNINNVLLEKAEDLTNRSLRKTIIIRGIPEEREEVSWDETRKVVVNVLMKHTGRTYEDLDNVFERIHRASQKKQPKDNRQKSKQPQPRIIHALLRDWNEIDKLSSALRKSNEKNSIFIDQQYGPLTTYRRNVAMKKRMEMKEAKLITGGHVKFPAVLFVKYTHGDKFVRCDDFSKIPIPDDVLLNI